MGMYSSLLSGGIAGWWASIEDAMSEAAINTVIGISVVFLALVLFVGIISLFKYINAAEQKLANRKSGSSASKKEKTTAVPEMSYEEQTEDLELIAVITAAIHAYEEAQGNTVSGDLVVRSIRKRNSRWQNA